MAVFQRIGSGSPWEPVVGYSRAVRAGRVYAVDAHAYFSRPGPRLVEGVRILAGILHPELFGEPHEALRLPPQELAAALGRGG